MKAIINEMSSYSFGNVEFKQLTKPEIRFKNQIHYTIPIIDDWFIDLTIIKGKWGYKNIFSKGELTRELVYTNEDNDKLKQALNEVRAYCNTKINKSFKYDYGLDNSNASDRLFTETVIELRCILHMIDKHLGGKK